MACCRHCWVFKDNASSAQFKRILVTGGAGFLGPHPSQWLNKGADKLLCIVFVSRDEGHTKLGQSRLAHLSAAACRRPWGHVHGQLLHIDPVWQHASKWNSSGRQFLDDVRWASGKAGFLLGTRFSPEMACPLSFSIELRYCWSHGPPSIWVHPAWRYRALLLWMRSCLSLPQAFPRRFKLYGAFPRCERLPSLKLIPAVSKSRHSS